MSQVVVRSPLKELELADEDGLLPSGNLLDDTLHVDGGENIVG
jgi:hypothetical protein